MFIIEYGVLIDSHIESGQFHPYAFHTRALAEKIAERHNATGDLVVVDTTPQPALHDEHVHAMWLDGHPADEFDDIPF